MGAGYRTPIAHLGSCLYTSLAALSSSGLGRVLVDGLSYIVAAFVGLRLWERMGWRWDPRIRLQVNDGDAPNVVCLHEGAIVTSYSPSLVSFLGESLDHIGQTMKAPIASLPHLRRHLGSSSGYVICSEFPLLRPPFLYLVCIIGLHWSSDTIIRGDCRQVEYLFYLFICKPHQPSL